MKALRQSAKAKAALSTFLCHRESAQEYVLQHPIAFAHPREAQGGARES